MSASGPARTAVRRPRQELTLILLLGAVGAGLALLASRQGWARVYTAAPRPLPAGVTAVSGQALVPATGALAVAALACLAAVLATRRLLRRIAGVVLAGFGAGITAAVSAGIPASAVLAAAAAGGTSGAGTGGAAPGSTTTGGTGSGAGSAPLSGFPAHVVFASFPWRALVIVGAAAVIAAGVLVAWRAQRLPVMSARFDRPGRAARGGQPDPAGEAAAVPAGSGQGRADSGAQRADSATMWEALSRGEDPTSANSRTGQRNRA